MDWYESFGILGGGFMLLLRFEYLVDDIFGLYVCDFNLTMMFREPQAFLGNDYK